MKKLMVVMLGLLVLAPVSAFATDPHNDSTATATATATGGTVGAISNNGGTHVQTNTQTTVVTPVQNNTQLQNQGQQQGQGQLQGQGQKQSANNEGINISNPVQDRMPGLAVAPGLTAAGTGVCLGSVSIGLSGPMAGLSFGITKVDKGCEQRSAAALLYQFGYREAAVRLLMKNDDVREALGSDAPAVKSASVAPVVVASEVTGITPQILSTNFGTPAVIQGN